MGKATLVLFLGVVALVAAKPYENRPLVSERELSQQFNGEPLSDSYWLNLYDQTTPPPPQSTEASGDQEESAWEDYREPEEVDEEPGEAPADEPAEDAPEKAQDQPHQEEAGKGTEDEADQERDEQAPLKDHDEAPKQGDRPEKQEKPDHNKPEGGHRPPKEPQGDSEALSLKPSGPQEAGPRRNPSKSAAPLVQVNVNIAPGV